MSETTKIEQRQIGFKWAYKIEREVRKQGVSTKYDDKDLITVELSGNAETYDEMISELNKAREEAKK